MYDSLGYVHSLKHKTPIVHCKKSNCDLSRENVHLSYPLERLKTVCLPFAIRLSSVRDRWDAVRTDWVIRLEKFLVVRTAAAIRSEKNLHPFERLRTSVRIKFSSFRTAEVIRLKKNPHPFERLRSYVRIKSSSVRRTKAIRSKKWSSVRTDIMVIRSNG